METRSHHTFADRFRPALVAEIGSEPVERAEPLSRLVEAAVAAKLDQTFEIYRFLRASCSLEAAKASPERRTLVARIARMPEPQESRLLRIERATMAEEDRDRWHEYVSEQVQTFARPAIPQP